MKGLRNKYKANFLDFRDGYTRANGHPPSGECRTGWITGFQMGLNVGKKEAKFKEKGD